MPKKTNVFAGLEGLDKKSVQFLHKAISDNNLPGFDYLEFKQSLNALKTLEMDEALAIKSAYTTGSTVGLTKTKLLSSADHYKKVLQTEKKQFDTALQNQMDQRVHGKKEEKASLSKKIEDYKARIAELEEQVMKVQDKLNRADEEIEAARMKIEDTRDKFETAFAEFVRQIDHDVEILKSVL